MLLVLSSSQYQDRMLSFDVFSTHGMCVYHCYDIGYAVNIKEHYLLQFDH